MPRIPSVDFTVLDVNLRDDFTERCAIIYRDGRSRHIFIPVRNSAPDPFMHFEIVKHDIIHVLQKRPARNIVGFVHTHPIGAHPDPSEDDIERTPRGFLNAVYHQASGFAVWYTHKGLHSRIRVRGRQK